MGISKELGAYKNMISRCYNEKNISYKDYGGRGITVCDRWLQSFDLFLLDMGNSPSVKHSIDRFPDINGNYEPSNCRWATTKQQARGKRNNVWLEYGGQKKVLFDWAKYLRVSESAIRQHMQQGKTFEWVYNHFKGAKKRTLRRMYFREDIDGVFDVMDPLDT